MEAQRYCRHNYTDLASVRNTDENGQIARLRNKTSGKSWIGLSSSTWRWLDGSPYSFENWAQDKPTSDSDRCGVSNFLKWFDRNCSDQNVFVCSNGEFSQINVMITMIFKQICLIFVTGKCFYSRFFTSYWKKAAGGASGAEEN